MSVVGTLIVDILSRNAQFKTAMAESTAASKVFAAESTIATGTSAKLGGALNAVGLQASSEASVAQRLGGSLGGIITPTTQAAGAGLALLGVMGDSVRAAIDEQAAVSQLTASLNANAPAWGGNLAAIQT